MRRGLDAMALEPLDALIVGGGATGCAAAWDAARRGLRVGLVEARDFGSGTTAATTRLAHGGLRYLELLDLGQVREGLRERQWLLAAAPHLVAPLPFLLPVPRGRLVRAALLRAGLAAYDALAPPGLPGHRWLRPGEAQRLEPRLRRAAAWEAAAFYDAQIRSPERLVLEFAIAAQRCGAIVANHSPVVGLAREGAGWAASIEDERVGRRLEVRARVVLNCAGPWAEQVARLAGIERPLLRATRGSHVAFPNFLEHALVLRARDGRTFFALPWHEVTLVGTTDLDDPRDPGTVDATPEDVAYLLEEVGKFLDLGRQEPCYTTAGVRAMRRVEGVAPGAVPRRHEVLGHEEDGAPGFLTVVGGKLTTARSVASDAIDAACRALGRALPAPAPTPLPGEEGARAAREELGALGLLPSLEAGLALLGGRLTKAVLEGPAPCERHATLGQVRLAVEEEWCSSLADFMMRRSLAGHSPDQGAHCAPQALAAMAELLGWDEAEREAQLRAYEEEVARRRAGLAGKR